MPSIAFPLRLDNGFLRRSDEPEAILSLIRAMAMTPSGSWAACPIFGIRDLLEQAVRKQIKSDVIAARVNESLKELGIVECRLENIHIEPGPFTYSHEFTADLVRESDGVSSWSTRIETAL